MSGRAFFSFQLGDYPLDKVRISAENPPLAALPLEDSEMIRITLHYFYNIGAVLQPLKSFEAGQSFIEAYAPLLNAEEAVEGLLRNNVMPLRTCYETGSQLLRTLNALTAADLQNKETLNAWDVLNVKSAIEKFETVLAAELQVLDTYFVSQKAGYATVDLIGNAEILIPESIRQDMPDEAIMDFKAGGRCLAFELPTAAGFHLLRSTEAVLHGYYDAVATKKNIPKNATMGTYITNLEAHGGDKKVMAVLRQITDLHRNPLMHPQDTLTMTQAIILIGIVISAIAAMVEGIQQTKRVATLAALATPAPAAAGTSTAGASSVPPVAPGSAGTP